MTLELILKKLDDFEKFADVNRVSSNGLELGNHQLVPIFDAVENGLRRFVLVYGTGAGKTVVPMEIIRKMRNLGKRPKILLMAPKNTFLDESMRSEIAHLERDGMYVHRINNKKTSSIPDSADMVTINYEKLNPKWIYLENLIAFAKNVDLVIPDEFQDIRNRKATCSMGYQQVILASKDARLIGLSASPIYDKLTDAGMLLFTINPERYGHYKEISFNIDEDRKALYEMKETGQIRFFHKEDVALFHNLPEFIEHEPILVKIPEKYVHEYFRKYQGIFQREDSRNVGRLISLERTAINAMLESADTAEFLREKIRQGHVLNFFSHLMYEPREGTPSDAIFRKLESLVRELGAKNVEVIGGHTSEKKRKDIQRRMNNGEIDALINQWKCTSQGFSETAGNRQVFLSPLRSPYAPGRHLQIIGRSWRPGQKARVEYGEFHAHSDELLKMIDSFVRRYAKSNRLKVKSTWEASLFHDDAFKVRRSKERATYIFFTSRTAVIEDRDNLEVSSERDYAKMLSKEKIIDYAERGRVDFGTGTRNVIRFVGKSYDEGLKINIGPLSDDYHRDDILLHTPGKINWCLADFIESIKRKENAENESWKIADLGCCSSAVFAQARLLYQTLELVRNKNRSLDHIVNVDGNSALIINARDTLERKDWLDAVKEIKVGDYSKEEITRAIEIIRAGDDRNLEFLALNFAKERIPGVYDVMITSQCLQYNDQVHERDIEKIVMNINQSLRHGRHYLTVLSSNSRQRSFTSESDIANFNIILRAYGFEVLRCEHIEGRKGKEVVVSPFYLLHAVKATEAPSRLIEFIQIPIVYSDTIEVLTGGYKDIIIRQPKIKKVKPTNVMPTTYVGAHGRKVVF